MDSQKLQDMNGACVHCSFNAEDGNFAQTNHDTKMG